MKKHVIRVGHYGASVYEVDSVGVEHFIEIKSLSSLRITNPIPIGQCGIDIGWREYPVALVLRDLPWDSGDHTVTRFD